MTRKLVTLGDKLAAVPKD
jgi:hypothetical protein